MPIDDITSLDVRQVDQLSLANLHMETWLQGELNQLDQSINQ